MQYAVLWSRLTGIIALLGGAARGGTVQADSGQGRTGQPCKSACHWWAGTDKTGDSTWSDPEGSRNCIASWLEWSASTGGG